MMITFQLGSKVRRQHDEGWAEPGCVMSQVGDKLRVFWPDENVFTDESPADLLPYGLATASQPVEVAA